MPKKNLLVLGATGESGIITVQEALNRGHSVTVYAREPEKLPLKIRFNPKLMYFKGDLPSAPKVLTSLLADFDAIISLLGPNSLRYSGTQITDFYAWLLTEIRKLAELHRPYLLAVGSQSIADPSDGPSFFNTIQASVITKFVCGARKEIISINGVFGQAKYGKDLEWTVFRLNLLKSDTGWPRDGAIAGYVGKGKFESTIDREQLAVWLVREAEKESGERKWVCKMPALWGVKDYKARAWREYVMQ